MRLLAGAERGDGAGHRLGIGAAEAGNDAVVVLAFVEALGDAFQQLAQLAAHGVPPVDLGLRLRHRRGERERQGGPCHQAACEHSILLGCILLACFVSRRARMSALCCANALCEA
jgi:hypothetical protein